MFYLSVLSSIIDYKNKLSLVVFATIFTTTPEHSVLQTLVCSLVAQADASSVYIASFTSSFRQADGCTVFINLTCGHNKHCGRRRELVV